ncbi:MAG TPA: hypothetical protein VLA88_02165 [Candidatus Saccharimonadales bacterium]|nr:hypothetical protein [Candidatus Saccharimonadales bacterium]
MPENTPQAPTPKPNENSLSRQINRVTALILVFSAILFATISILAIWQVFGDNTSEIVWRSLSSLGTIALAALVVNVGTKLMDGHK